VHRELEDLPQQLRDEIFHFFTVYKDLDVDRHSEPSGWKGRDAALKEIAEAQERHRAQAPH
jgi:inorganic pyrophosphatase